VVLLQPADDLAIREVVHRYADAVVHRDAEQWGSCFADDARWDLGRATATSRAEAVELFVRAMGNMQAFVQVVHNGAAQATDDPDRATGRWYIGEHYRLADGTPGVLAAHYDDEYVRGADGAWRFASRVLTIHYAGPPDLGAAFLNTPDGLRAAGRAPSA
jgi:hypothetical protein